MQKYSTLIKRECWEHRTSFFIAPLFLIFFVALIVAFGEINTGKFNPFDSTSTTESISIVQIVANMGSDQQSEVRLNYIIYLIGLPFFCIMALLMNSYFLSSLRDDRKDKSIYFWNSMPVSHTETVLSKLFSGLVLIPIITIIAVIVAQLLVIVIVYTRLSLNGDDTALFLGNVHIFGVWLALAINYIAFAIASLGVAGFLLLCSAYSLRPFLFSFLILIGLLVCEYLLTGKINQVVMYVLAKAPVVTNHMFGYGLQDAFSNAGANGISSSHIGSKLSQHALNSLAKANIWYSAAFGIFLTIISINIRKYNSSE